MKRIKFGIFLLIIIVLVTINTNLLRANSPAINGDSFTYLPIITQPALPMANTERISISSDGSEGDSFSWNPTISGDGRYVAFGSNASNLVPGDTNNASDVFVHDRDTGVTELISVATDGSLANDTSFTPAISADGRYVAFGSVADNLVSGDTNGLPDIFVKDRQTGVTKRVSVATNGSQSNGVSFKPDISADGRYVGYESRASNLVSGDTNGFYDIFTHDLQSGITDRISIAYDGSEGNGDSNHPSLSADGRFIAFQSAATNFGVFADTNGALDIFIHDRQTFTYQISMAYTGGQTEEDSFQPSISDDGRYIAFHSLSNLIYPFDTNNVVDVFVNDRVTHWTERASEGSDGTQGNLDSEYADISSDGRYVTFLSAASNLVPDDTNNTSDIFVHDLQTNVTVRVSISTAGDQANDESGFAVISGDGRYIAFESEASNLVLDDTNGTTDVFVHDRGAATDSIPDEFR